MARPIKETPVLKGEDAFNFEMRRLEVENRSPKERAEARRKFQERGMNFFSAMPRRLTNCESPTHSSLRTMDVLLLISVC